MKSLKNQIAVITGASSGIGKSIALELAKQGVVLCLLGRDLNSLEEVAHIAEQSTRRVHCYSVDITIDQETNVRGPYRLTQILLPMLKLQQGQVIFINSRAVFLSARPGFGQYTATKLALKAVADSFRQEVKGYGIRVLSVYPGRTASSMQKTVYKSEGKTYQPELLMQPADIAATLASATCLPRTAEVTDITLAPLYEPI
jgi:NADP-dependent 3-hydroxy acid dehydrogenase YdfG